MGAMWKLTVAALLAVAAVAPGCGNGGSSTASDTVAAQSRPYPWLKGPSRQFLIREGDNVVQTFGREATKTEREQASRVIENWMQARAAQAWKEDCRYFSRRYVHTLVVEDAAKVSHGKVKNCAQALAFFGHQASGSYRNNLTGPIDSLRVGEGHGYAQYHGDDGHDWVIPVDREGGRWLVANATPIGRSS